MNPRREYALTIVLFLLGAFALLIALSNGWAAAPDALLEGVTPSRDQTVSGSQAAPAAAAAAWIGFAAIAGVIATRSWGRVIVGAIVTISAVAGAVAVITAWAAPWSVIALLGLLALTTGGMLAVLRGRTWPSLSRRYERDPNASQGKGKPASEISTWDALDRGEDPTA